MNFGICNLALAPIRKEACHTSEMVSQLLFGEHFEILEQGKLFSLIKSFHDKYVGWLHNKQYSNITKNFYDRLNECHFITNPTTSTLIKNKKEKILIPAGVRMPQTKNNVFHLDKDNYQMSNASKVPLEMGIEDIAKNYINSPYIWGGRTEFGIDCSGLTQAIYRFKNINIPRDSQNQEKIGKRVNINNIEKGDLLFFCDSDDSKQAINHVAMSLGKDKIIHSSGHVRVEKISSIKKDRKLVSIKTIISK